jgi:hypothetical protein
VMTQIFPSSRPAIAQPSVEMKTLLTSE